MKPSELTEELVRQWFRESLGKDDLLRQGLPGVLEILWDEVDDSQDSRLGRFALEPERFEPTDLAGVRNIQPDLDARCPQGEIVGQLSAQVAKAFVSTKLDTTVAHFDNVFSAIRQVNSAGTVQAIVLHYCHNSIALQTNALNHPSVTLVLPFLAPLDEAWLFHSGQQATIILEDKSAVENDGPYRVVYPILYCAIRGDARPLVTKVTT